VGHGGSGKTSLAEALLLTAGVTNRLGSVEAGTATTDSEPEEADRQGSVFIGLAPFRWNGTKINLIDTPGPADFIGEVRGALRAADLALFVVSGVEGPEVQTEVIWRLAEEEGIARAFFINKLDRERADYTRTVGQLKTLFGTGVAPVEIPIGHEAALNGVAGIVANHAFLYTSDQPRGTETDIPDEIEDTVATHREHLIEAVVESDDALLEAYFEGTMPTNEQLVGGLRSGILEGTIFPVLCGSATRLIGIDRLAELLVRDGPSPLSRPLPPLAEGEAFTPANDGPVVAYVFKTMADPYVGRISMFRVYTGTVKLDMDLENPELGVKGRMHNLFTMRGKDHEDAVEVAAGDIAAVAKLETTLSGHTLRSPGAAVVIEPVRMPAPTVSVAVSPKTSADEDKLSTALARITEEDPTLTTERRSDTNQTLLSGLGDAHLDVSIARMQRRYGVQVDTAKPRVPYRESIRGRADVEGKHKKQTGGRGQFGVAFVKFEPLPRGEGYQYVDAVKGGSIPRSLIPAVDKGIREALGRGLIAGYPVVDIQATVYDGKYHSVDSDEMSFRMAGIHAVRAAIPSLNPILLEPIMDMRVTIPEDYTGEVIGDLNSRRGRVLGMEPAGGITTVVAQAPQAEVQRYAIDLRSITGGRGHFEMAFSHYEEAPPQETEKVVAAAKAEEDD
jgi:elongation factor G